MVKIQFSVKSAFIQKYTLLLTVVCLVMTLMNMINRIHYIGASYAIGAILMGITNHIHNSLSITGIGCILDMLHLIFRSSNSSWASVRYFQFIIHFLAIVYELIYMTMLHCYWQYTEATKNQPQTSWLKNQMILPSKLGQFSAATLTPRVVKSQPIQVMGQDAAMDAISQEPNAAAANIIVETPESSKAIPEPNAVPKPSAEAQPNTETELSVSVAKPTLSSTVPSERALNSIVAIPQPIEATELSEISDAQPDPNTTMQEPNSVVLDANVETQKAIASIEPKPVSEPSENAPEDNIILTEPSERLLQN